jgi:hypothetical protein
LRNARTFFLFKIRNQAFSYTSFDFVFVLRRTNNFVLNP